MVTPVGGEEVLVLLLDPVPTLRESLHQLRRQTDDLPWRKAVDPVELVNLGEAKASASRREAVAGYDLTFTLVKSVTTLWGLASEPVRQHIVEAHEAAVASCLVWCEKNVAFTRTGDRGQAQIDTQGVIAAQFSSLGFPCRGSGPAHPCRRLEQGAGSGWEVAVS